MTSITMNGGTVPRRAIFRAMSIPDLVWWPLPAYEGSTLAGDQPVTAAAWIRHDTAQPRIRGRALGAVCRRHLARDILTVADHAIQGLTDRYIVLQRLRRHGPYGRFRAGAARDRTEVDFLDVGVPGQQYSQGLPGLLGAGGGAAIIMPRPGAMRPDPNGPFMVNAQATACPSGSTVSKPAPPGTACPPSTAPATPPA